MLSIKNLHACVEEKQILNGLNLEIKAGEIHAIMGPNGSGKSTLSQVLAGNEAFDVTKGEVTFNGGNLLDLATEERAREGIFLAFQYPVEIPGVSNLQFLRTSVKRHAQTPWHRRYERSRIHEASQSSFYTGRPGPCLS